jgi:hypothetical protein
MNQLGNFAFRRTKHLVGVDLHPFLLFPLVFVLGAAVPDGESGSETEETISTAATGAEVAPDTRCGLDWPVCAST